MDLSKNGKFLCDLRKARNMTQKQVADKLGVVPKTVSKWETGRGFVDVSKVSALADVLGVSEKTILAGKVSANRQENGNMKKTKFYVCEKCGNFLTSIGNAEIVCCGRKLMPLDKNETDEGHLPDIEKIEDEYYIRFSHPMTKEHYISFVSYVRFDRVLTVKLYPEQDAELRFPEMRGGKMYYFCTNHGLFELKI